MIESPEERMIDSLSPNGTYGFQPVKRLLPHTRALARRGLNGEFGRAMVEADPALRDQISDTDVSAEMRYALAVKLIAENAPIRILDEELIIGSAVYREAAMHRTPIDGG